MGNILNHNRDIFKFEICKKNYWDFQLSLDSTAGVEEGLSENCLSAFIDINDNNCVWFDDIMSKEEYVWDKSVNTNTLVLSNFGYTSVDNGKTFYEKDKISNKEFFNLFTNTIYSPKDDDLRLTLSKVKGDQQIYDYSCDVAMWNENIQAVRLNGGWYQGFFQANDGSEYRTLPNEIGDGWNFEFELNKEDFHNTKLTLNGKYPENKGIFFYIGTRAENKWWIKYLTDHNFDWCKSNDFSDDYVTDDYIGDNSLNDEYFKALVEIYENDGYFEDDYIKGQEDNSDKPFGDIYIKEEECEDCSFYARDEYIEKELNIDPDMKIETEGGYDMYQPNIKEIKTDNKFIIFDRTKDGFNIKNWDENIDYRINYIKKPNIGNYFTMFHRGCDGYDVHKIQEVLNIRNKEYDVLKDLYNNAFALQVKDDGSIGYKYLVSECDGDKQNYKIESEFSSDNIIKDGKWHTVNIKITPVGKNEMTILFYVDARLVFKSKQLPILRLRSLDDLYEKQEGVPYNISLGGGTQGLAEVVYLNYMKLPEYTLPLEKEFGGSFIGWIKSFKFYTCPQNFSEIAKNYNFTKSF